MWTFLSTCVWQGGITTGRTQVLSDERDCNTWIKCFFFSLRLIRYICDVLFWGINLTAREWLNTLDRGTAFSSGLDLCPFEVNQKAHSELSCSVSHFSFLSVQLLLVMKRENLKLRALHPSWTLLILYISFMTQLEVAEIIRASSYLNPFSTCPPRKSILIIISKLNHLFPCSRSGKETECKLHLVGNYSRVSFISRIWSCGQVLDT